MENIREIRKKLSRSDKGAKEVISDLKNIILEGNEKYPDLISIEAQSKKFESEKNRGVLSTQESDIKYNKINDRLLSLMASIEEGAKEKELRSQFYENLEPYNSTIYIERTQITRKMYELIIRLEFATDGYLNYKKDEEAVIKFHNKALEFFEINELMFNEETGNLIRDTIQAYKEVWVDYSISEKNYGDWQHLDKELRRDKADFIKQARDVMKNRIPNLKKEIKEKFRAILGVK